jgi:hypothetical protein
MICETLIQSPYQTAMSAAFHPEHGALLSMAIL